MGIEVLPPDVNSSDHGFVVSGNSIRFGLDAVKNVGHAAVEAILVGARGGRPVRARSGTSANGSTARAVNKRAIECLIKCGALDSTGAAGAGCSRSSPRRSRTGRRPRRTRSAGRHRSSTSAAARRRARAGRRGRRRLAPPAPAGPRRRVRPARAAAAREGDAGNVPLRASADRGPRRAPGPGRLPARRARRQAGRRLGDASAASSARRSGCAPSSGAYVMFATLDDLEGQVELFVFDAASEAAEQIEPDRVRAGPRAASTTRSAARPARRRRGRALRARRRRARGGAGEGRGRSRPERIVLRVDAGALAAGLVDELKTVFENFPGESEVLLEMSTRDGTRRLRFGPDYRVSPSPGSAGSARRAARARERSPPSAAAASASPAARAAGTRLDSSRWR